MCPVWWVRLWLIRQGSATDVCRAFILRGRYMGGWNSRRKNENLHKWKETLEFSHACSMLKPLYGDYLFCPQFEAPKSAHSYSFDAKPALSIIFRTFHPLWIMFVCRLFKYITMPSKQTNAICHQRLESKSSVACWGASGGFQPKKVCMKVGKGRG